MITLGQYGEPATLKTTTAQWMDGCEGWQQELQLTPWSILSYLPWRTPPFTKMWPSLIFWPNSKFYTDTAAWTFYFMFWHSSASLCQHKRIKREKRAHKMDMGLDNDFPHLMWTSSIDTLQILRLLENGKWKLQ